MIGLNQMSLVGQNAAVFGNSFSPLSLFAAGEQGVWYDPSDFSTMFQDSAGTTPVTATGQPVGKILDKSGRGNHATQTTAGSRPTLQQDSNGHYYLSFDGVDDFLVTNTQDYSGTDKLTMFASIRKLSGSSRGMVFEMNYSLTGLFNISVARQTPDDIDFGFSSTSGINSSRYVQGYTAPVTALIAVSYNYAGSTPIARINGQSVSVNSGPYDNIGGSFSSGPLYIGRRAGTQLPFNGNIYGLIIRGTLSTNQQITNTETWLNSKTGAY